MPLDPHAARLLTMVAAGRSGAVDPDDIAARRRALAGLMRLSGPPMAGVAVSGASCRGSGGPIALRCYAPPGAGEELLPGLIYFHGGGLVAGSLDTHDALCRALCAATGARVVAVDYRLAPEARFPAAVADARDAALHAREHAADLRLDPRAIALGGDSAGGTLAAVTAGALRDAGQGARSLLLLCPVLDASAGTPSRRAFAQGYLLDADVMARDLNAYAPGGTDLADPRLSPLREPDLTGMPPTIIHTAEFDPVRDEGARYAERLGAAHISVRHTCHTGMIHHFYALGGVIPRARTAIETIGAELRAAFATDA